MWSDDIFDDQMSISKTKNKKQVGTIRYNIIFSSDGLIRFDVHDFSVIP